jgi:hypothetical protein
MEYDGASVTAGVAALGDALAPVAVTERPPHRMIAAQDMMTLFTLIPLSTS